ncbi:MAG: NAD(P)-dependent alcohol dehydrogenase [Chitinophagales bacterium]|nr:NAD(P)-dependent alcohol dehydrogenase [Chitinophagales bacterium]MCZ2393220.1 NAD(P)-dependent alcohol dehydrogenase [Chitinophagales bacterium]
MYNTKAYAAFSASDSLQPFHIERRELRDNDILIDILFCGVCHSDIHTAKNDWHSTKYPVVPGHEIIGRVQKIGKKVSHFNIDDIVGVGCMVDSCQTCTSCQKGLEQYCLNGFTGTYNGKDKISGAYTFGGYSDKIVVQENFVLRIPQNLDIAGAAPLLCAGITTWSPLKNWNVKTNDHVGIIGLGGLGHMAIKLAHAMGAKVTMITTSPQKGKDAKRLGADDILISTDKEAMKSAYMKFDFLLNTIPVKHDANPYIHLLKTDGTMVFVGAIEPIEPIHMGLLIGKRRNIGASLIGGIKETQEMLDFCGEHNITSDIEIISIQDINQAYERIVKNEVKYRFVIDMNSLKQENKE